MKITCGEDNILGDKFMIHNGELGQFNLVHPCHSVISSSPVEFNVISGITIWYRGQTSTNVFINMTYLLPVQVFKWLKREQLLTFLIMLRGEYLVMGPLKLEMLLNE